MGAELTLATLRDRVAYWQHHPALSSLGLGAWDLSVEWLPEDNDDPESPIASAEPHHYYDEGELKFSRAEIDNCTALEVDRAIVHELLHIFMRDLDEAAEEQISLYFPFPAASGWRARVKHEREGFVDRMARTIVALDKG